MFPLIVMLALVIGGYAAYLVEIGEELNYQAHALAPVWYMFKPHLVTQVISDGGYLGTLAAVGMNIVHALLFSAVAYSLVTIGFAKIYAPRNDQPKAEEMEEPDPAVTGIYPCDIPGCTMMVMIPDSRDASTGAVIPGVKDADPLSNTICDATAHRSPLLGRQNRRLKSSKLPFLSYSRLIQKFQRA